MRRLVIVALLLVVVVLAAAVLTAAGGEEDKVGATYEVVFDNAFGLTEGGDLRIAGVRAGTIDNLRLTSGYPPKAVVDEFSTTPLPLVNSRGARGQLIQIVDPKVLAEESDGWADQVQFTLDAGVIKDTYVLSYDWDVVEDGTGVVSWSLVSASVLKAMNGSYSLASDGDSTKVTYRLSVDVKIPMIGMLKRKAEKVIIDTALKELKKRVEA